jgi:outer membrane receptor protein involved in Fe transport
MRGTPPGRARRVFACARTCLGTLLCAGLALADNAPDAGGGYALDTVQVTGSRRLETVFDASSAVTVLTGDQVRQAMPQTLPEALRARTGTYFQQTTPGQGTVILRGLKGSQVLHLVDGMRLNNAFFRSAPNQYLALVDPYNVAALEVIRGPSSTLYGGDAMGGVVQVLTPEPVPGEASGVTAVESLALAGTADQARVGRFSVTGGGPRIAASTGFTYQEYGHRKTGDGDRVVPSDYRSRAYDAKGVADLGQGADLMLSAQYSEQPNTPRVDELVPGFGQTEPASEEFAFHPNSRRFYHARLRMPGPVRGIDRLTVHAARQVIVDDRRTRDTGSTDRNLEDNESDLRGITLQADSSVADTVQISWGLEYYTDEITSRRRVEDTRTGEVRRVASRFPDGSSLDSTALFVAGDAWIGDVLRVSGGLRYSRFDIDIEATDSAPGTALEPDDVTGNIGLWIGLGPGLALVTNAGRGFRPPNIFDLGTLGPRPGNRFNVANDDLDPESVYSVDAGLKLDHGPWQAEAFAYYSRYEDRIESVPTGEVTADGRIVVRSENIGEVTLYGLETGARYVPNERWEAYGVLNWTRGEDDLPGGGDQPADRIPPLNGRAGLLVRPWPDVEVDGFALFAAEQDRLSDRDAGDPRIDPDGTPGWATWNLRTAWRARAGLELELLLENLLDKRYREHGSGIDARGFNGVLSVRWNLQP